MLAELLGVAEEVVARDRPPSWNVAPGADVPVVAATSAGRRLGTMRWGLVPSWSADPVSAPRPINARVESLVDRPVFAGALARRRCLVMVDGFYEWRRTPAGPKQPYFLDAADGSGAPLALAGLWDRNGGEVTCAIVTGPADDELAWLHHRMPIRIDQERWEPWLDRGNVDSAGVVELLQDAPATRLRARPVGTLVNSTRHDGPELLDEVPGEVQPPLL